MKILLRENDGKIWALDPETGAKLTTIIAPNTRCDDDLTMTTAYVRHQGIFWNSWHEARQQLFYHEIITDDDPGETPIINHASFDPADMLAENMTIRQAYKLAAMTARLQAKIAGLGWDYDDDSGNPSHKRTSPEIISREAGRVADAMIEEDKRHEAKGK